jgi:hypothetical protein
VSGGRYCLLKIEKREVSEYVSERVSECESVYKCVDM